MKIILCLFLIAMTAGSAFPQLPPPAIYWKFTVPLAFEGKAGLIDTLLITRIDNMNLSDATIVYQLGWVLKNGSGVVTEFKPQIDGAWRWNDGTYQGEVNKVPTFGLTRGQDLLNLFYTKLASTKPEWAGTLVTP